MGPPAPERSKRGLVVGGLATLAVAGLGVAGFMAVDGAGTDSDDTVELSTDAPEVAAESPGFSYAAASEAARTAASMSLDMVVEDSNGVVDFDVRVDRPNGRMHFDVDASRYDLGESEGFGADSIEMILDEPAESLYLTATFLGEVVGDDFDGWLAFSAGEFETASFDEMFTNPLTITDVLGELDPVDLGDEVIDGETLRRFQVVIDGPALVDAGGSTEILGAATDDLDEVHYDVWVSADDEVRRIAFETSDPVSGHLAAITMDVTTPDDPIVIDLPAPEDIVDFEDLVSAQLGE